jgi:predicted RNA-binding protein with RPS1 domain
VTGLVHKSELSWDSVVSVDTLVQKGQVIFVKVIDLDAPSGRLGLSLKQTQPDPIKMTLDTLEWGPIKSMPREMEAVEDVYLGRQAVESKISSQELVVYLTKDVSAMASMSDEAGFDAVARVGNVLQELHVVSAMGRVEARSMLARVLTSR